MPGFGQAWFKAGQAVCNVYGSPESIQTHCPICHCHGVLELLQCPWPAQQCKHTITEQQNRPQTQTPSLAQVLPSPSPHLAQLPGVVLGCTCKVATTSWSRTLPSAAFSTLCCPVLCISPLSRNTDFTCAFRFGVLSSKMKAVVGGISLELNFAA